jgi:ubiquinone/menaquinone biosynthesis C-methylase UbiE
MSLTTKLARVTRPIYRSFPGFTIRYRPGSVKAWLPLIDRAAAAGRLSPHYMSLVRAHEINTTGHAVNAFAREIENRCGETLKRLAQDPDANIEAVVDELVRWKTIVQCGNSHDVSKGYFQDAEAVIDLQWNQIIYPIIQGLDFSVVLDLACGHGRNSDYLRKLTKELHLVDMNESCLQACRERFGQSIDGTRVHYHLTDGNHLRFIPDAGITLVYTWDSMVHFDKLVVQDYVREIARVLRPGGSAFLHHSNFGAVSPDSDWASNEGTRSDMSAELMRRYAAEAGLEVVRQDLQGRKEGWGRDDLDCVSVLRKP